MNKYHLLLIPQALNNSGLTNLTLVKVVESSIIPLILFHGSLTLRLKHNYKVRNTLVLLNTWLMILLVHEARVVSLKPF